jgi:hypothetical protein
VSQLKRKMEGMSKKSVSTKIKKTDKIPVKRKNEN